MHTNAYHLYQQIQDSYSQARLLYYRSWVYVALKEQALAIQDIEAALVISRRFNLPLIDLLQQRLDKLRKG